MKKRKLILGHLIIICALSIFSCSDLTSSINAPVKEYFQKYSDTALITSLNANRSKEYSKDGIDFYSGNEDLRFTLPVINPREYTLVAICDFDYGDEINITESDYNLSQDDDDKAVIHFNFNKNFLQGLDKLQKNINDIKSINCSGLIKLVEKDSNREFLDFKYNFAINSRPPAAKNMMIQQTIEGTDVVENNNYVLCFFMPDFETIENGVHANDTKKIVLQSKTNSLPENKNSITYYFKYENSNLKFYQDALCTQEETRFSLSENVYQIGSESPFSSFSNIANYKKVFYKTGIQKSTQELEYAINFIDDLGINSNTVSCSNKEKRIASPTVKYLEEDITDSSYSYTLKEKDRGQEVFKILANSLDTEGNSITNTTIKYEIKETNNIAVFNSSNSDEKTSSINGEVSDKLEITLGKGVYEIKYSLEKDGYIGQTEKTITIKVIPYEKVYVTQKLVESGTSYEGNDTSGNGSYYKPYKTIKKAIEQIIENRKYYQTSDEEVLTVSLIGNYPGQNDEITLGESSIISFDVADTKNLKIEKGGTSYQISTQTNHDYLKITNTKNKDYTVEFTELGFTNLCNKSGADAVTNTSTISSEANLKFTDCNFNSCKYGSGSLIYCARDLTLINTSFENCKSNISSSNTNLIYAGRKLTLGSTTDINSTVSLNSCEATTLFYAKGDIDINNVCTDTNTKYTNAFASEKNINYNVTVNKKINSKDVSFLFYLIGNGTINLNQPFTYNKVSISNFVKLNKGSSKYGTITLKDYSKLPNQDMYNNNVYYTVEYEQSNNDISGTQLLTGSESKYLEFGSYLSVSNSNFTYYIDINGKIQKKVDGVADIFKDWSTTLETEYNQYENFYIYTTQDLEAFAKLVNGYNKTQYTQVPGKTFKNKKVYLKNNILGISARIGYINTDGFSPVHPNNTPFSGEFYGNDNTITLINKTLDNYGGVFTFTSGAKIEKLKVNGSTNGRGGIISYAYNSTINGCENSATINNNWIVGGVVGFAIDSKVLECKNISDVTGKNFVGGVVGFLSTYSSSGSASIENCVNKGNVKISNNTTGAAAGGIVGKVNKYDGATSTSYPTVKKSTHEQGTVIGYSYAGGIAGNAPVNSVSQSGEDVNIVRGTYSVNSTTNDAQANKFVGHEWTPD